MDKLKKIISVFLLAAMLLSVMCAPVCADEAEDTEQTGLTQQISGSADESGGEENAADDGADSSETSQPSEQPGEIEPEGPDTEENEEEKTGDIKLRGEFAFESLSLRTGEKVNICGSVSVEGSTLKSVTVKVTDRDKTYSVKLSGKTEYQLAQSSAMIIDGTNAPFNTAGQYEITLWAQTADGEDVAEPLDKATVTVKRATGVYDPAAAVKYAEQYNGAHPGTSYNTAYDAMTDASGYVDCANFVSQCLYEGGLALSDTWKPYTIAWINTGALARYLGNKLGMTVYYSSCVNNSDELRVTNAIKGISIDDVSAGDVIFTYGSNASLENYEFNHVVIVDRVENGTVYFCGHSTNRCGCKSCHAAISTDRINVLVKMGSSAELKEHTVSFSDSTLTKDDKIYVNGELADTTFSSGTISFKVKGIDPLSIVRYTYNEATGDVHTLYPTGMTVWMAEYSSASGSYSALRLPELDNCLIYSGSSIRISSNKDKNGIRLITGVPVQTKKALRAKGGIGGFTLYEYGTAVAWTGELGGRDLTLGRDCAKTAYAYRKDVADPIFSMTDETVQYTNTLVGFSLEQCADDLIMRPYMKLKTSAGKTVTIYGGEVSRSIGYIAWQNRAAFSADSKAFAFIWDMIHSVYADKYDEEYIALTTPQEENGEQEDMGSTDLHADNN